MEREAVDNIKWLASSMLDNFPGCIMRVVYTKENMWMEYVSEGAERIFGETSKEYQDKINRLAKGHVASESVIWGKEFLEEAFQKGQGLRREYTIRRNDGENRWIEVRSSIVSKEDDKVIMQYVLLDIDEQKRAEEQAKKEHDRLEIVAGLSTDSVFEYNIATDCMRYYNRKEMLIDSLRNKPVVENYTARIMDGSILNELFHPDDREKLLKLCDDLHEGKPEIHAEVRKQYEQDKYTWVSVEAKTIPDKQGAPSLVIGKISNIDEKVKKELEIRKQMEQDPLTGLYNKQTAEQLIAKELSQGTKENAYVVLTDVDEFKKINDIMGHLFGDGVLCTFANHLRELFPESILGRVGGDEFILYLKGLETEDILARIARINRRLSRIHAGDNDELKISVSFGFAKCDEDTSLTELKHKADVALCYLKQNSKGTAALYEDYMEERHVHLEKRDKRTLERDSSEAVINTEGDIILFAHELFDNSKDIRGALRLLSDVLTRFYHFQDILFVHKDKKSGAYKIMFHWGENNTDQFYYHPLSPNGELDWERLLYQDDETEYVVLTESDFVGENVNKAKSMVSFRVSDDRVTGYCVLVDRRKERDWKEEMPLLLKVGDFVVKRYFMQMEKQRQEEEAEYKSKYDRLTGMMNLTYFTTACEQRINANPDKQYILLYTDFTNFKFFNETYGYNEGNNILKEYARFLEHSPALFQCRITADSFVALYEMDDVELMKQRFLERGEHFCETAHFHYTKCKIGIAGGIAVVDRKDSISLNIDNANMARKRVKKDTTVQVEMYTPELKDEQQKQMEIVSHMEEALENHEFKVFLQPKMDMFTDKVIGAEALVRWFKPDGSMVSPGEFIPIFEENGFVTHLDFEMMRQVLDMQQKRLKEGKPIVKVSVNFSRKHQEDQSYLERLDELMSRYDVPADAIEIEITESVFMQDLAPLIESICQLKERGFSVSIDDFGAGYSSLNVLSKVKADIVKLDRQFLLDVEMEKDNFTSEFLQLLIYMIKKLGFRVLAEGVETAEQVTLLKNAGCRFAQGFYYARPMPIEDFLQFLDHHMIEDDK